MAFLDNRPAGMAATLSGGYAFGAAAPALFGPLAVMALSIDGAPLWTMALAVLGVAPLVALAGVGATRALPASAFAAGSLALAIAAALFAWMSGGSISSATPWLFAALTATALLGGPIGAGVAASVIALVAVGAFLAPDPPTRLFGFAPRAEREAVAIVSWSLAALAVASVAWSVSRAWANALPPLRHPTIAARKALSMLAEGAAICALRVTPEDKIAQVLGAPERTLEFERDQLRTLSLSALAHPDDAATLSSLRTAANGADAPTPATVRLRSRLGGYRWLEFNAMPVEGFPTPPTGPAGEEDAILIFRDRWRRVADPSPGADIERANLLAHVGANLRASLKSIVGFTDILRNELFGPLGAERYRDYARLTHDAGVDLLDRVEELLDLADIEAGRYAQTADAVEFAPLVDGALRLARSRAEAAGVALKATVSAKSALLTADRRALRRVLATMLADAVRRLSMGDTAVLEASVEDGAARFAVKAQIPARTVSTVTESADAISQTPDAATISTPPQIEPGEARLGRMVALSLCELMGGALIFMGEDATREKDGAQPAASEILISEAIMPLAQEEVSETLASAISSEADADTSASQASLFGENDLPNGKTDVAAPNAPEVANAATSAPNVAADDDLPLFDLTEAEKDRANASWDDTDRGVARLKGRLKRRLTA